MNLHAIVPVKALKLAKSRLAADLPPHERRQLVIEMLEQVLATLRRARVDAIWVVSADPEVHSIARASHAYPIAEQGVDLNAALEQARSSARAASAEALLVVPADVPLLSVADIDAIRVMLKSGADAVLAPDSAGRGTNALALRAAAELPFSFGEGSAERHLSLAAERGLVAQRLLSPTLGLDVDDRASLASYRAHSLQPQPAGCAIGNPCA